MEFDKDPQSVMWHVDIGEKIGNAIIESHVFVKNGVLKTQDQIEAYVKKRVGDDVYKEWEVLKAIYDFMWNDRYHPKQSELILNYYIDLVKKGEKIPRLLLKHLSKCFEDYLSNRVSSLEQAFYLQRKAGRQKQSKDLTQPVLDITTLIIEHELELTLAVEEYQRIQEELDETGKTEATPTTTLMDAFHQQKQDALFTYIVRMGMGLTELKDRNEITDKARKLVGKYWRQDEDVFQIGTNRDPFKNE